MRLIDADRALEIVRDQGIAHPNAYYLTNYATLVLQEAPTITDLSKCIAFNSAADHKPHTNADRIRSMSDEELSAFLNKIVVNHHIKNADNCNHCPLKCAKPCDTDGLLEWLKQEVSE